MPVFARVDSADPNAPSQLCTIAAAVRRRDAVMIHRAGLGHIGSDFSVADILVVLYFAVMNFRLSDPDRDRLVLSKGHAAGALYATFAALGVLPDEALNTFAQPLSPLSGHPANLKVAGVEASTGPLGHGLPVAVGMALAAKLDGSNRRTFVVVGDGELEEGSNWEAMMVAAHHQLTNLSVIVDCNGLQQGATTASTTALAPLDAKAEAFGFDVTRVDGHDPAALLAAFTRRPADRPTFVIAQTIKGYPVSFMCGQPAWHHKVPDDAQLATILDELGAL